MSTTTIAARLAIAVAGLSFALGGSARAEDRQALLAGRVTSVTDGDTIRVQLDSGPIVVRLSGIDAPERRQAWGPEARTALDRRVNGHEVLLEVVSQDRYDRLVATVYREDAADEWKVNAWLVKEGHAWVYRQFARDESMCGWEDEARRDGRGLWKRSGARPVAPWEWRQSEAGRLRTLTDFSDETEANCVRSMRDARRRTDARGVAGAVRGDAAGGSTMSGEPVVAERACLREAERQSLRLMGQRPAQAIAGGYLVALSVRGADGEIRPVDCRFWANTGRAEIAL
jgi:micrococcal nuclease